MRNKNGITREALDALLNAIDAEIARINKEERDGRGLLLSDKYFQRTNELIRGREWIKRNYVKQRREIFHHIKSNYFTL